MPRSATARAGSPCTPAEASAPSPSSPVPTLDSIPAEDLLVGCEAIVRVQHRYGERKNRNKARMKYVVQKMGLEGFRATVEEAVRCVEAERGAELRAEVAAALRDYRVPPPPAAPEPTAAHPGFARWRRVSVRPQRQAGYAAALVHVPLGDLTTAQMRGIAAAARAYGNGTLRPTNDQNLLLPWVPETALPALHQALLALGLAEPEAGTIHDVVSCPGMDYCSLAITRSMGVADRIRDHLAAVAGDGFAERLGPFGVKVSGCPNSCGQHHVGDIGLTGHSVTGEDGVQRPYYSILVGGRVGEGLARVGRRLGRFREEDTPAVIAALARTYADEREDGERFADFVDRVGLKRLADVAAAAAAGPARPRPRASSGATTAGSSPASTTAARAACCAARRAGASTALRTPSWRSAGPSRASTACARACGSASTSGGPRAASA